MMNIHIHFYQAKTKPEEIGNKKITKEPFLAYAIIKLATVKFETVQAISELTK